MIKRWRKSETRREHKYEMETAFVYLVYNFSQRALPIVRLIKTDRFGFLLQTRILLDDVIDLGSDI